jgi:hypothetical protein
MKPVEEEEEEEEEFEDEIILRRLFKEAEMDRAAKREEERQKRELRETELRRALVEKKPEGETGQERVRSRKFKAPPTPTYSNTFCVPEDSDTDSDSSEEENLDVVKSQEATDEKGEDSDGEPLWIPRGYKALDKDGRCKAGTEFDLPAWLNIDSVEEVDRLARVSNQRNMGLYAESTSSTFSTDRRYLPVISARVPKYSDRWPTKENIAHGLAIQQEYEKLDPRLAAYNCESMPGAVNKWKCNMAEDIVKQRETSAQMGEAKAVALPVEVLSVENTTVIEEVAATDMAVASIPLQESSEGRVNQSIQKARADAEKYKPKIPSGLRQGKNMSPINDKNVIAYMSLNVIMDTDVINTVMAIPDENIIPEVFLLNESPLPPKRPTGLDHPSFEEEVERAFAGLPY